ncbi:hypothetical protein C0995_011326 [Termitomyces sp. Mi166|nr:hypothetical protein C0995_011326 [Termitomyces sp. Mi166\
MAPKILLLNVSPNACLLECKHAAQKFIVAANTVFLKAQGLAMLAPLHETVFGLLKGLLDDWRLLNLMTIEWLHKAEVCQACVNIWSLNKQVPWAAEFRKTVMSWEHAIASSSAPKLVAAAALSKPAPAKSVGPAVKGGSIFKDPFMVRQFKLVDMEESGALIINQATEVPATQGTLRSDEFGNKDAEGNNDDSDGGNVTMNVDSAKQPEETWPVAPTKTMVIEVKVPVPALAPVLSTKLKRTPFFKLHCTTEHFPHLPSGLQAPIQFKQNRPSVGQWQN